jgi:hypothetical protein
MADTERGFETNQLDTLLFTERSEMEEYARRAHALRTAHVLTVQAGLHTGQNRWLCSFEE